MTSFRIATSPDSSHDEADPRFPEGAARRSGLGGSALLRRPDGRASAADAHDYPPAVAVVESQVFPGPSEFTATFPVRAFFLDDRNT